LEVVADGKRAGSFPALLACSLDSTCVRSVVDWSPPSDELVGFCLSDEELTEVGLPVAGTSLSVLQELFARLPRATQVR
jgi:hypothetical protein